VPYAASMNMNIQFINDYLRAVSGKSKPADLVNRFVSDPALQKHIADVEAAFPEYQLEAQDILADDDKVVVRATFRGIHRGVFAGIEPTGKTVSAGLIIIYQIDNAKIVEHWMQFDLSGLLQQLQTVAASA
jgi:predicted ester cyclase